MQEAPFVLLRTAALRVGRDGFCVSGCSDMCLPLALGDFQIAEHGAEGGILRAAGVNAEQDFTASVPQVADAEL